MTGSDPGRPPRVALFGAGSSRRAGLARRLRARGCHVVACCPLTAPGGFTAAADVLLVDLEAATESDLHGVERLVDQRIEPMVFLDASGPEDAVIDRAVDKLRAAAAVARPMPRRLQPVAMERAADGYPVWVLAASFGGPQMLSRFFGAIREVPAAAFVIAQHIGEGFAEVLAQQLNRLAPCPVICAAPGMRLRPGHGFVAPVGCRVCIGTDDRFRCVPEPAATQHCTPSIDAVMQQVAQRYGRRAGAIVFSGMGCDGACGADAIARAGGVVWAQDAASCASDSMPERASATGAVTHRASPERLARDFVRMLRCAPLRERGTRRGVSAPHGA